MLELIQTSWLNSMYHRDLSLGKQTSDPHAVSMSAHHPSRFHLSDRNKTFFGERSPWRMDGPWMWDCEMQCHRLKKLTLKPMDVIIGYRDVQNTLLSEWKWTLWSLRMMSWNMLKSTSYIASTWQLCDDMTGLGYTQFFCWEVQLGQLAEWCVSSSCPCLIV